MDEFLSGLASENVRAVCRGLDDFWSGRTRQLNDALGRTKAAGSGRQSLDKKTGLSKIGKIEGGDHWLTGAPSLLTPLHALSCGGD